MPQAFVRCSTLATFHRRRGVAAVELAIVLPVLVLLALAGVDLGRSGYYYVAVSNAARAGAEHGSLRKTTAYTQAAWQQKIRDVAREEVWGADHLDAQALSVDIQTTIDGESLNVVTVTASYSLPLIVEWPGLPNPLVLRHAVTMRQIR